MFGLFRARAFADPALGELSRRRGRWRGRVSLAGDTAALSLPGSREAPDADALAAARDLPARWESCRADIARDLFDHYSVLVDGGVDDLPRIDRAEAVWPHATPVFASFDGRRDAAFDWEIGIRVAWDDDHLLGARLLRGRLVDLCGSVLEP